MSEKATEADYRTALYAAQRALMHANRWVPRSPAPIAVLDILATALKGVNNVLDIGRDEANEQTAT